MGRLATYIAGRASSADKLPGQLPIVSLIDALLPRIVFDSSMGKGKVSRIAVSKSLHFTSGSCSPALHLLLSRNPPQYSRISRYVSILSSRGAQGLSGQL